MKNLLLAIGLLGLARAAEAQSVLADPPGRIDLLEIHARIEIREAVATRRFRLVFHNQSPAPNAEATFFLELEPGQKVDRFKVRIAGKDAEAEILDQEKARAIYEDIVRKRKDPALLESYGDRLLRVRLFPIPPLSEFEAEIETVETLDARDGVVRVRALNVPPSTLSRPLRRLAVTADVVSSRTVKSLFSPTHAVNVSRRDAREVRLTYDRRDVVAGGPFTFYAVLGRNELGATMLAAPDGEDGAFMLALTPPVDVRDEDRLPRDVSFLVDASGSMNEHGKIDQAKEALHRFVATLTERDRFNVVTFSTEAQAWSREPVGADATSRERALRWIDGIRARGGTNLEEALQGAPLLPVRDGATRIVVLLSDGTPTIGERDTRKLVDRARALGARVFAFGVGADVNTRLLDRLALETGGDRQYVDTNEDLALVVEGFARRLDAPVLSDVSLSFEGTVSEVHPRRIPDLFRGGEATVLGRFRGKPPARVEISGTAGGKPFRRTIRLDVLPDARHAFVVRLWAIRKIDFLIDEIRERGTSKELVEDIVEVAKRYGIVTPYTSFLMTEDAPTASVTRQVDASNAARFSGRDELRVVDNQSSWRSASSQEAQLYACNGALGRGNDAKAVARTLQEQRLVSNRAFYHRQGGWAEGTFAAQAVRSIRFGSDEYFRFVRENPETAPILALGNIVTFQHRNAWFRVEL